LAKKEVLNTNWESLRKNYAESTTVNEQAASASPVHFPAVRPTIKTTTLLASWLADSLHPCVPASAVLHGRVLHT
jgi:hypothetical protein